MIYIQSVELPFSMLKSRISHIKRVAFSFKSLERHKDICTLLFGCDDLYNQMEIGEMYQTQIQANIQAFNQLQKISKIRMSLNMKPSFHI